MQHQEFEPPEALRDSVKCLWYDRRVFGPDMTGFEILPDGYAEIVFTFGEVYRLAAAGDFALLPSPLLMGLLNRPVRLYARHDLEMLGVRCFPWMVFDLLELPAGRESLQRLKHPLAGLQPELADALRAGYAEEALALLSRALLAARARMTLDRTLFQAGEALRQARGDLPVSAVAAAAQATVRTLERKFRLASGHTVRDVASLMRFEQVRNRLWHDHSVRIADLAYELGFADQAHLSRDFKRYTGTTPAAFARAKRQDRR